jgi:hypothetical protein
MWYGYIVWAQEDAASSSGANRPGFIENSIFWESLDHAVRTHCRCIGRATSSNVAV